jgi:hypothetical protein
VEHPECGDTEARQREPEAPGVRQQASHRVAQRRDGQRDRTQGEWESRGPRPDVDAGLDRGSQEEGAEHERREREEYEHRVVADRSAREQGRGHRRRERPEQQSESELGIPEALGQRPDEQQTGEEQKRNVD